MNRRNFIQISIAGSSAVLVPSLLTSCDGKPLQALEGWKGPPSSETDATLLVLSYAILAPNPHNKQPWIVDLVGPLEFDLFVDPNRLLAETDPPFRQIHIGQGTFLENLDLAAKHLGYRADISYFPEGMYSNQTLDSKPIARINLVLDATVQPDPLFDQILIRQSNKRVYDGESLTREQVDGLKSSYDTEAYTISISQDLKQCATLADFAVRAMKIEVGDHRRDSETLAMFRFNDVELNQYRDGFGVANSGSEGVKKWIAESFFLSRESVEKDPSEFGAQAVGMTKEQSESASAYGWITSKTNTRLDQVQVGRAYERVNLTATALGVALHPFSQVLQEYTDMASLQDEFKAFLGVPADHTVQMFFRLGHAEPVQHTPRRKLADFFKQESIG